MNANVDLLSRMPFNFEKVKFCGAGEPLYFENLVGLDRWHASRGRVDHNGLLPYVARDKSSTSDTRGKLLICHDYKVRAPRSLASDSADFAQGGYSESPDAPAYTFNFWDRCDTFI